MRLKSKSSLFLSRRALLGAGGAAAAASLVAPALAQEAAPDFYVPRPVPVTNGHADLSPDEALALLEEGNRAFLANRLPRPDFSADRRLDLAQGQAPFVAYVSCSDSRVPPELLFGRGLGELFIIRNAGNTLDTVARGSVEYAVAELRVPLV
ncbi:carbonic anhydrase, partial [Paracoccus sp. (in: a-proteobacteria)]|uniref:carbonic anhydrase n=1 Tax=Paracoccus sp. TaxID=267 RepID=UPI00396C32CD